MRNSQQREGEPPVVKIVLTGGPCAGKSTLAEILGRSFPYSVVNLPEAASLLFAGGFPRFASAETKRATQRAIFHVQKELEAAYGAQFSDRALILDRGTVDGAAYWPEGTNSFFAALGTTLEEELRQYDHVLYLESVSEKNYAAHKEANPFRRETWAEACALDERTKRLWMQHPSFTLIRNQESFAQKVSDVLAVAASAIVTGKEK